LVAPPRDCTLGFLSAEACSYYTKGPCGGFSSPSPLSRLTRVAPGCLHLHHPSVCVEQIGIEPIGVSLQGRPVHQHLPHVQPQGALPARRLRSAKPEAP